ncbi:MAG: hypothetical protein GY765_07735 [bacterium]|nr:hypothetical protein [bacterium]
MKKCLLFVTVALLATAMCAADKFDFSKLKWGTPRATIIKMEAGAQQYASTDTRVSFKTTFHGIRAIYGYRFAAGKLSAGAILLNPENFREEMENIIAVYHKVSADYTKMYGKPLVDDEIWNSEKDKRAFGKGGTEEDITFAVNFAALKFKSEWRTKTVSVKMSLGVENVSDFRYAIIFEPLRPAASTVSGTGKVDFEKAVWGMTRKQLEKLETGKVHSSTETGFCYKREMYGLPVFAGYTLKNGRCNGGGYIFQPENWIKTLDDIIADYHQLKADLSIKYGTPSHNNEEWQSREDKLKYGIGGSKEDLSYALNFGLLSYNTQWDVPRTKIRMVLVVNDLTKFNFSVIVEQK